MTRAKRILPALLLLVPLLACARHVVVAREAGRVDGSKSISSMSDDAWTLESEPSRDDR